MGGSASRPATHRSLDCRTATVVEFCNDTEHEVEVGLLTGRRIQQILFACALRLFCFLHTCTNSAALYDPPTCVAACRRFGWGMMDWRSATTRSSQGST